MCINPLSPNNDDGNLYKPPLSETENGNLHDSFPQGLIIAPCTYPVPCGLTLSPVDWWGQQAQTLFLKIDNGNLCKTVPFKDW